MKNRILHLFIFLIISPALYCQQNYDVHWDYRNQSFKEFVLSSEKNLNLRFFYRDEWVDNLKLQDVEGTTDLRSILDKLFHDKLLYYYIDETGNVVITKNFRVKTTDIRKDESENFIPPSEYSSDDEKDTRNESTSVTIGNPADRGKPGKATVSGYITNKDTKEPIPGVTVFVQELSAGAVTNAFGYYTLELPRGFHQLQFSFIGLRPKRINLNLNGTGELNVDMISVMIPLKETVISAQKSVTLQRFEVGAEKINITTFKLLPTAMGESDIIKSMLLIPGVQSIGEGSAGFNVRGGSADQNLVLLYGAPVYNTSHFFGFFSAVNSDIIKDVTLYKGGIPSRYGGRLSSVLDITARDGDRSEFRGNAGISPVTTHLMLEGPIKKDTLYYVLSGRTTYSNWLFSLFDNPSLKRSRASFYDLNGRLTWEADKNNKIDVSGYYSNDAFRFNSDTTYGYENSIVSARWRHFFHSRFFSTISANNSGYRYNISSDSPVTEGFDLAHKLNSTAFKADFNLFQGRHEFNFGIEGTAYIVHPGTRSPLGDSSLIIRKDIRRERALETALYIDDKYSLTQNISVNAGLRFSSFFVFGPGSVLIYDPEYSKSSSTVTDTVFYRSHTPYKTYAGPELRMSVNFRIDEKSSLKVNYNHTMQYLHLLSNTTSISPTDTWKISDSYIKPQTADQFAVGYYRMLSGTSMEVSAEVYYKTIKNMADFKGGSKLVMNENIGEDLVNVNGRSYGGEFMIKRTEGKVRGSISYTYSRTFVRSTGVYTDEIINGGKWFPANFDKPNDLIISLNYLLSRRFSMSGNYTWSTGRPITYPVAAYYYNDMLMIHYSDRNKYRLPDYSRLDFSFRVSGNLKAKKIANPYWTFSVYNLLGRKNVYSIYFKNEKDQVKGYKLSVFGQAIPTVTFSFDF
ncbi:MAG TPA: TonB-dependent receptor [Bacteroidales bacterium]|nr:TonB-dependent receptor [Bacteroidales bacterium]